MHYFWCNAEATDPLEGLRPSPAKAQDRENLWRELRNSMSASVNGTSATPIAVSLNTTARSAPNPVMLGSKIGLGAGKSGVGRPPSAGTVLLYGFGFILATLWFGG